MLISGILYALATGILWGGAAVVISGVARKNADFLNFMAITFMLATSIAWILIPRYSQFSLDLPRLPDLVCLFLLAGAFTACGMVALYRAMTMGHHAATWTIGQSALVFPFVLGVLVWNDTASAVNISGVVAILMGIIAMGVAQRKDSSAAGTSARAWLVIVLLAFVLLGIQQTLTTIPSRWHGWTDSARLRIPILMSGAMLSYVSASIVLRRLFRQKWLWRYGLALMCIALVSQVLLFKSLDMLGGVSRAALVFPISIGTCIISFSLYSAIVLREPPSTARYVGMGLGVVGVILSSIG